MTYEEAQEFERYVDKILSMGDLDDGRYLWSQTYEIDGDWVILVNLGNEE
jgi:hypothetical protein